LLVNVEKLNKLKKSLEEGEGTGRWARYLEIERKMQRERERREKMEKIHRESEWKERREN
jgi:hypothetical protein